MSEFVTYRSDSSPLFPGGEPKSASTVTRRATKIEER